MSQESYLTARLSLTPDRAVDHDMAEMNNTGFDNLVAGQDNDKHATNVDTTSLLGSVWNLFKDVKDLAAREIDRFMEQLPYSNNQKLPDDKDQVLQPKKDRSKIMLGHGPPSITSKRLGAAFSDRHWSRLVDEELRAQTNDLTPASRVRAPRAGSVPLPREHRSLQESYTPSSQPPSAPESPAIPPIRPMSEIPSTPSSTSMKRKKHVNVTGPLSKSSALEPRRAAKINRRQGSSGTNPTGSRLQHTSTLPKRASHRHTGLDSEGWGSSTSTPGGYEEDSESSFSSDVEDDYRKERESSVAQSIASLADLMNLSDSQSGSGGSRYPVLSHRRSQSEHLSRRRSRRVSDRHRPWARTDDDDDTGDSEGRRTMRRPRSALDIYSSADPLRTFIPSRPSTPQPRPASQLSFQTSQPPPHPTTEDHDKLNKLQEELAVIKAQLATLVSAQQEDSRRLSWPSYAMPTSLIPPPPPPPPPPAPPAGLSAAKKWSIPNSVAQSMQDVLKELSSSQHRLRKTNSPYLARTQPDTPVTSTTVSSSSSPAVVENPASSISLKQKAVLNSSALKARRSEARSAAGQTQEPPQPHRTMSSTLTSVAVPASHIQSAPTQPSGRNSSSDSPGASFQLWARRTTSQATPSAIITPSLSSSSSSSSASVSERESPNDSLKHTLSRSEKISGGKKTKKQNSPSAQQSYGVLTPSLTPSTSSSSSSVLPTEVTPIMEEETEHMDLSVDDHHDYHPSLSSASTDFITGSAAKTKRKKSVGGGGGAGEAGMSTSLFSLLLNNTGSGSGSSSSRVSATTTPGSSARGSGGGGDRSAKASNAGALRILTPSTLDRSGSSRTARAKVAKSSPSPLLTPTGARTKSLSSTASPLVNGRAVASAAAVTPSTPTGAAAGGALTPTGFKRPRPARSGSSSSSSSSAVAAAATLQRASTNPTHLSSAAVSSSPAQVHKAKKKQHLLWTKLDGHTKDDRVASATAAVPTDPQRKQVTFASTTTPSTSSRSSSSSSSSPSLHEVETSHKHERERKWFLELDNDSWRVNS
ncbi:hypothetical protein DFQ27_000777 [Actinomortierella ambigua]|uniref:Uncharacterized protein n=1 Tax=Actinomortierella ambigua TaxID=1343610 RepID=A0A9P6QFM0_9FUNG|nr:hypothetical protein DFQ27_000777 [Actinomortierella ambigua]